MLGQDEYTPGDLEDHGMVEEILREAKFRTSNPSYGYFETSGYDLGQKIYSQAEELFEEKDVVSREEIDEIFTRELNENWISSSLTF